MKEQSKEYQETLAKMLTVRFSEAGDYASMSAHVAACRASLGTDEQIGALNLSIGEYHYKLDVTKPVVKHGVTVGFYVLGDDSIGFSFPYLVEHFKELTSGTNNKS